MSLYDKEVPIEFLQKVLYSGCKYLSLYRSEILGNRLHLENLSKLRYLDMSYCFDNIFEVATSYIEIILDSCFSLQKLNLNGTEVTKRMVKRYVPKMDKR